MKISFPDTGVSLAGVSLTELSVPRIDGAAISKSVEED